MAALSVKVCVVVSISGLCGAKNASYDVHDINHVQSHVKGSTLKVMRARQCQLLLHTACRMYEALHHT